MEFMSPEHVEAMNRVLAQSDEVRQACAELDRPRVMAYRLTDGPGGSDVHWALIFDDTMQFSLDEHPSPDILFTGDWKRMIQATEASRRGEALDPEVQVSGDPEMFTQLGRLMEVGRRVATFDVSFPAT